MREFWYDKENGRIGCEINTLPSGLCTGKPDGPRYFEFHPKFNVAYVVNELSCTVSHFCARIDIVHLFAMPFASEPNASLNLSLTLIGCSVFY